MGRPFRCLGPADDSSSSSSTTTAQDSQSTQNSYRSPADCPERGGDQSKQ